MVDYWKVNSFTVPDQYPLPLIQELMDKVKDAQLFTKINVHTRYNNIRFREGDKSKATFKTNKGLFKPTVMLFGLRNAPAVFQHMVNTQFADILAKGDTINYMDDFLVPTKDEVTHRERVNQLLSQLQKLDLYLNRTSVSLKQIESNF